VQALFFLGVPLLLFLGVRVRLAGLKRRNAQLESLVTARTAALAEETQRLTLANTEKAKLLTQVGEQAEAFARMAREDGLTGLANRRELDARLREEYERASRHHYPLSVAIVDADHFKRVNDGHGHAAGDEVLRRLGALLREGSREIDFVARFGGEEFVLVLPHTNLTQAHAICERLRKAVEAAPWRDVAPELLVTVSIGIAESGPDPEPSSSGHERLLARADARLYEAKENGRNRVVV
jgi:diguanylate cyclase (GGDEF)-like protein